MDAWLTLPVSDRKVNKVINKVTSPDEDEGENLVGKKRVKGVLCCTGDIWPWIKDSAAEWDNFGEGEGVRVEVREVEDLGET